MTTLSQRLQRIADGELYSDTTLHESLTMLEAVRQRAAGAIADIRGRIGGDLSRSLKDAPVLIAALEGLYDDHSSLRLASPQERFSEAFAQAESIAGPDGASYLELMEAVSAEAIRRRDVYAQLLAEEPGQG